MRSYVCFSSIVKSMLWGLANCWKAFSASFWLWKYFPYIKVKDTRRSRRWLTHMVGKAEFNSPFIQLLKHWLWQTCGWVYHRKELDRFCWLMAASGIAFSVHPICMQSCNSFSGIQEDVDETASRQTVVNMCMYVRTHMCMQARKFGFRKRFEISQSTSI